MPTRHAIDPIDSRQLLTVVTLARTRSFTEAAKQLSLTQSAVSHSLKALEKQLGQQVFERKGRWVQPTQAGDLLLREATEILNRMQRIRERLDSLENWGGGRLRVGAGTSLCHTLLPPVLREFRQSFPHCSILVKPDRGHQNFERLRQNEVDLIMTVAPPVPPAACEQIEWFSDELVAVLPPFHPYAQKVRLRASDFEGCNVHLYGDKSPSDALIQDYMTSFGVRAVEFLEVGSVETVKEMVKLGQGIAFLPNWAVEPEVEQGSLMTRPLEDRSIKRQWSVFWSGRRLNLQEETFLGLCMEAKEGILGNRVLSYYTPSKNE